MTLFLKYRPQSFQDLVGQSAAVRTLCNALKAAQPSHAYIFTGARGTGKTSTARIFAKGLVCPQLTAEGNPCNNCDLCQQVTDGNLVDVLEIDAASHTGVDNIRELLSKVDFAPSFAKRKVYLIDEVHMLSKGAFNALLKTLEEPPEHVFFCLATTELHKVPATIASRCQTFYFRRFTTQQMVDRLRFITEQEQFSAENSALVLLAERADGSLRDAISLLEQSAAEGEKNITETLVRDSLGLSQPQQKEAFYQALKTKNAPQALEILQMLESQGVDFRAFSYEVLTAIRADLLSCWAEPHFGALVQEWQYAISQLRLAPFPILPLEIAVLKICQSKTTEELPTAPNFPRKIDTPELKEEKTAAPTPKTEKPTPSPAPTTPPTVENPNSSLAPSSAEQAKNQLLQACQQASTSTPSRVSLKTAQVELNKNQLHFIFDSEFHQQQVTESDSWALIREKVTSWNWEVTTAVDPERFVGKHHEQKKAQAADFDNFEF